MKDLVAQIVIKAKDETKTATKNAKKNLSIVTKAVTDLKAAALSYFAISTVKNLVKNIIKSADAYKEASDRIRLATDSQENYNKAQSSLFKIAQSTRTELDAVNTLFSRTNKSILELGKSQNDTLKLVNLVTQSGKISGASASENAAAIRQFSQALSSGILRGDEFNSIMENSPRLALALADGLKVTKGELRAMSEAGQLSSEKVINALLSQTETINGEFGKITTSVTGSLTQLENAWVRFIGRFSESSGAAGELSNAIGFVADNFTIFANTALTAISIVATAFLGKGLKSVAAYAAAKINLIKVAKAEQLAAIQSSVAIVNEAKSRVASTKSLISQTTHTATLVRLRFQLLGQTQALSVAEAELAAAQNIGAVSAGKQALSFKSLATAGNLVNLAMAAMIGWEIGSWARDNIPGVKSFGSWMGRVGAQTLEVFRSIFTLDFGGLGKRLKDIRLDFASLEDASSSRSEAEKRSAEITASTQKQISAELKKRGRLEKELAVETKKLALSSAKVEIEAHKKVVAELEADVEKSISAQQKLADKIISLQQSIAGEQERASDKIRGLKREGLSEDRQQLDIQAQVAEVLRDAQQALQAGDAEEAKRQAKRAESIADELNDKQKVISAIEASSRISQEADQLSIQNAIKAKEAEKEKQLALEERIKSQKENIVDLNASLLELEKPKKLVIEENIDAITAKVTALQQKLSDLKGGINLAVGDDIQKNAAGGSISGAGTGTSDSILSWVSNGEYILRQAAAAKLGKPTLDYINKHGKLPAFATGGSALFNSIGRSNILAPRLASNNSSSNDSFNVVLQNGNKVGPFTSSSDAVSALRAGLDRESLKFGKRV